MNRSLSLQTDLMALVTHLKFISQQRMLTARVSPPIYLNSLSSNLHLLQYFQLENSVVQQSQAGTRFSPLVKSNVAPLNNMKFRSKQLQVTMPVNGLHFLTILAQLRTTTRSISSKVKNLKVARDTYSDSVPKTLSAIQSSHKKRELMLLVQEAMFHKDLICIFITLQVRLALNGTTLMRPKILSLVTRSRQPTLMVMLPTIFISLTQDGRLFNAHLHQTSTKLSYPSHNLSSSRTNFIQSRWLRRTNAVGQLTGPMFGQDALS